MRSLCAESVSLSLLGAAAATMENVFGRGRLLCSFGMLALLASATWSIWTLFVSFEELWMALFIFCDDNDIFSTIVSSFLGPMPFEGLLRLDMFFIELLDLLCSVS